MIKVTFCLFKSFNIYTLSPLVHVRSTVFIVFCCFFEIWKTVIVILIVVNINLKTKYIRLKTVRLHLEQNIMFTNV